MAILMEEHTSNGFFVDPITPRKDISVILFATMYTDVELKSHEDMVATSDE